MPEYLAPGVYVEEVPSAIKPIAGVGTSTAGFIGEVPNSATMPPEPGKFETDGTTPKPYALAPAGEPQLITSWVQFKNAFGDFQPGNRVLAHAVYGFFNNGGTRCWVARVVPSAQANPPAFDAAAVTSALEKFAAIDEIAVVAVPGAQDATTQVAVIDHCERTGDRFAILDGQPSPSALTPAAIKGAVRDSTYAALYFPWITVFDPASGQRAVVPPSGHLAGVYARVDTERGVHKAPANTPIRGALDVDRRLSKADQSGLNPDGINVLRLFDGGVTVWGARTLGGDRNGEFKYVNVRRLFLFLKESIDQGTNWVVFEPNAPDLWSKIRRNVSAFLHTMWTAGALIGATPEQAFYVRCDETTNPQAVRDLGQVVTEIGVAVVKPAEFVVFRVSQWAGSGQ